MNPKFRIWVKQEKKMFPVVGLTFSKEGEIEEIYPFLPEIEEFNDWPDPYWPNQVVLMQSTGHRDINGTELFIDDVFFDPEDPSQELFTIASLEDWFSFKSGYIFAEIKILGNIHENPELLIQINEELLIQINEADKKRWADEEVEPAASYQAHALKMLSALDEEGKEE